MTLGYDEIRDRYRGLVLQWEQAGGNPRKANRIFRKHHAFYKEIRELADGRRALESLLVDVEASVRLLAATHTLPFAPEAAIPVLSALQDEPSLFAVDAEHVLVGFRDGTLNLDW